MPDFGMYFLANDAVLDQAIAFLNSLRKHMPTVPLTLIPFDSNTSEIRKLQARFGFDIFDDSDLFLTCDEVGRLFHGSTQGHYRKLAAWEGHFKKFLYIDADTVILRDLAFVCEFLSKYDFITAHSDLPTLRRWVWKRSIVEAGYLSEKQIQYSTNTGFICSRRSALPLQNIRSRLCQALELKDHMELLCVEQPLLNYLIVTSSLPYTSVLQVRRNRRLPDLPVERWAGTTGGIVEGGEIRFRDAVPSMFVHWAGAWPFKIQRRGAVRSSFRDRDIPYKSLWDYYRFMNDCDPEP